MLKLQEHDIIFLLNKTKLPLKSLLNLIEEERDFDLVIDSIASTLMKEDKKIFPTLSEKMRVKLAVYHYSKDKNYDIEEKAFISSIITYNYDYFYKTARKLKNGQKKEIKQFLSVIKSDPIDYSKFHSIADKFAKNGQKELGHHLKDWAQILHKSREFILV